MQLLLRHRSLQVPLADHHPQLLAVAQIGSKELGAAAENSRAGPCRWQVKRHGLIAAVWECLFLILIGIKCLNVIFTKQSNT